MSETSKDGKITVAAIAQSEAATNIIKGNVSSTETVTHAGKKGKKIIAENEGILVRLEKKDIPAPEDGVLKNAPEVRDILRSVREEIRNFFKQSYREIKSKKILRLQELVAKDRTFEEDQEMEALKKEVEVSGEIYSDFKPIGKGGFGEVYRAKDTVLGEKVVLKIINNLSEDGRERLLREAKALVELEHDGILKGYVLRKLGPKGVPGLPGSENKYLIETESIEGENLEKISEELLRDISLLQEEVEKGGVTWERFQNVLKTWDSFGVETSVFYGIRFANADRTALQLPPEHLFSGNDGEKAVETLKEMKNEFIINVIAQACKGLDHAHKAGVLHRDIKPENLMVSKEGKTKVIDWGLVKSLNQQGERGQDLQSAETNKQSTFKTTVGEVVGTPLFMAPEQAKGKQTSIRSDIWEMGVTLVKSLTGIFPADANGVIALLTMIDNYELNWEAIQKKVENPYLMSVIRTALAYDPGDRFQTMQDLQEVLELYNALGNDSKFSMYLTRKVQEYKKTLQIDLNKEWQEEEIGILKEDLIGEGRSWDFHKALAQFHQIVAYEAQFT